MPTFKNANNISQADTGKYTTQLRMCSLSATEVAAVDSCFALVRAREHCIATKHRFSGQCVEGVFQYNHVMLISQQRSHTDT